jgi:hypothetical protein
MIFDPLYAIIKSTGIGTVPLALFYGLSFIIAMITMLFISGRQKRVQEYLQDPFGVFLWPFFVLAPIVIGYMSVSDLGSQISKHFLSLGLNYDIFSLHLAQRQLVFWVILMLAGIEGIENVIRYHRNRPKLWLSKPKWLQPISTVLFNIPLGIMALVLVGSLMDQWVTFHRFLTSDWLPPSAYHPDRMYGLRWVYNILVTHMTIAVFASFSSLFALIRESKQKHSWIYKVIFLVSISCTGLALFTLVEDMNSLFHKINLHFLEMYTYRLELFTQLTPKIPPDVSLQRILLLQEISAIAELPTAMPLPSWLTGIIGIRLLIFIPEFYATLAKAFGWQNLPANVNRFIELLK